MSSAAGNRDRGQVVMDVSGPLRALTAFREMALFSSGLGTCDPHAPNHVIFVVCSAVSQKTSSGTTMNSWG